MISHARGTHEWVGGWATMNVRAYRVCEVRRGVPLPTAEVARQPRDTSTCVECDVLGSDGGWFGTATHTAEGPIFVRPPEMRGVCVLPPFTVSEEPTSRGLARALGSVLSRVLGD
jgi:hypothetical protein